MTTNDKTKEVAVAHTADGNLTKNTEEHQPGKTGWDKASVIIQGIGALAIVVSIVTLLVGVNQFKTQQLDSAHMQATQVAVSAMQSRDQQRQATLDGYLNDMSNWLLLYHLSTSNPRDEVRVLAQSRTYEAVRNLDGARKGTLVRFLWEAGLINGIPPIINLSGADLRDTILGGDLSGLSFCANSSGCAAAQNDVNLSGADLIRANLSGAILSGADLSGADLSGATVTSKQLAQAKSLTGATMPDGSKHP